MRKISNNKKAQEFSIVTLVVLVLAIAVLVIVILGFWKGWDYVFGKVGTLPGNLEAAAQSCKVSAEADLATSYCYEFKEVTVGAKKYVNCEDLVAYGAPALTSGSCTPASVRTSAEALCSSIKKAEQIHTWNCDAKGVLSA